MKRKQIIFFVAFATALLLLMGLRGWMDDEPSKKPENDGKVGEALAYNDTTQPQEEEVTELYGFTLADYTIKQNKVKRNQVLSSLLGQYGTSIQESINWSNKIKPIYNLRRINYGKPYTAFLGKSEADASLKAFVYEINRVEYLVIDMIKDTAYIGRKKTYTERKTAGGTIDGSVYVTLQEAGANTLLATKIADIYAWTIDFYRIQKGDEFQVIYDESFVAGKSIGIDKIVACKFVHFGEDFYAFYFDEGETGDYFDETGGSLRKAFLKMPLEYGRLTSKFTMRRKHPVTGRVKPHLGTDYAAPTGTPILSTGDGVIVDARYKRNNGNYVKVKHNSTYTTQYLHMSKIKPGIKNGVRVRQGDIIGYVGSTGLATGPHVCYRFWKNGQQVDPKKQKIPPSKPVNDNLMSTFKKRVSELKTELAEI